MIRAQGKSNGRERLNGQQGNRPRNEDVGIYRSKHIRKNIAKGVRGIIYVTVALLPSLTARWQGAQNQILGTLEVNGTAFTVDLRRNIVYSKHYHAIMSNLVSAGQVSSTKCDEAICWRGCETEKR